MKRSFTEVYNEVYAKNNDKLESLKKDRMVKTIIFIFVIINNRYENRRGFSFKL